MEDPPSPSPRTRARRSRRARVAAVHAAVRPRRLGRPLGELRVAWWREVRADLDRWRVAFLVVLVAIVGLGCVASPGYHLAAVAWIVGGGVSHVVMAALEADLVARRAAHAAARTPSVAGYRLRADYLAVDPDLLLLLDLAATIHATARLVSRPVRGHRRGDRITYEVGLRDLSRRWAAARGLPVRRGDRLAQRLVGLGVIRPVRTHRVAVWLLAQTTGPDAMRRIEALNGVQMVDWSLGRDPDHDRARRDAWARPATGTGP